MRVRLALAVVALAATAVPSQAAPLLPDCVTALTGAATGATASCATQGPPPVACRDCGVRRTVNVVAVAGGVDAALSCDGTAALTTHVDAPGTAELGMWGGFDCTLALVATADGTTAVATSFGGYAFDPN